MSIFPFPAAKDAFTLPPVVQEAALSTHSFSEHVELRGGSELVDPGMNAFSKNVLQLMEHVEYRICEGGEDLENVFRLRYKSYLAVGMIGENPAQTVEDEFDGTSNAFTYGVYYDGQLVSTVRVHHITADTPHAPSVKVFGDVLEPRIAAGETFIDPSRFAADQEWSARLRVLPYITLRIPLIALRHFNVSASLTAIREEHSSFYRRIFVAEPIVRGRLYPGLTCPVDLWQSICPNVWQQAMARFAFFRCSPLEQRLLFTKSTDDYRAPLTILPSTKFLSLAA